MNTLIIDNDILHVFRGKIDYKPSQQSLWCYSELPEIANNQEYWLRPKATPDESGNAEVIIREMPTDALIKRAKAAKLSELAAHDQSTEVNGFTLNGKTLWLDAATRAKFRMAMEAAKALSQNTIELVLPEAGIEATIPTDTGLNMLNRLELYAAGCAIAAKKHQMAIEALTTPEALAAYDFKTGYPEKINLTL